MRRKIFLAAIIILAFVLRFYRLDSYPALNADEAAIGYNAYSLIQTGKDEHGNPWPVHFQSFNDYKPGLYFYIVLPFVKLIGLNPWAIRIPGATLGILTVFAIYLLVKELFNSEKLALFSSLFLAISPWHIHFSRGGWEVNAATFFIVIGTWLFFKASKNPKYYILSVINYVLSLYAYHAARIVVPLLGLGFVIFYRKLLIKHFKIVVIAGLLGLIFLIPLFKDLIGPAGISRAAGVGILGDMGPLSRINEQRGEHGNYQGVIARIFHNKVVNYSLAFLENWSKHYSGNFLFLNGDEIQRDKVPETGQMYFFDFIFLLIGLIAIMKRSENWRIIVWWLVVAPVASAFTFQSPHALRSQNMVIPLVIISAYGLVITLDWLRNFKDKKWLFLGSGLIVILTSWNFLRYLHMYWVHMAKEYPYSSQYGVRELTFYIKDNSSKFDKIIVTDRYDQPYILFLFYLKYPPDKFQGHHTLTKRDNFGFSTVHDFDKFIFEKINFDKVKSNYPNSLIIGTPEEIPSNLKIKEKIYGENGHLYFEVVEN